MVRLIWAHGELTGMKRGDNLSNESFGLNGGIGFTRFHTPVHVGYTGTSDQPTRSVLRRSTAHYMTLYSGKRSPLDRSLRMLSEPEPNATAGPSPGPGSRSAAHYSPHSSSDRTNPAQRTGCPWSGSLQLAALANHAYAHHQI